MAMLSRVMLLSSVQVTLLFSVQVMLLFSVQVMLLFSVHCTRVTWVRVEALFVWSVDCGALTVPHCDGTDTSSGHVFVGSSH